jgi:hypothetical protein
MPPLPPSKGSLALQISYPRIAATANRRIAPVRRPTLRPYQSQRGDFLIEALRVAVDRHRERLPTDPQAFLSDVAASIALMSPAKRHVLHVVLLILRAI